MSDDDRELLDKDGNPLEEMIGYDGWAKNSITHEQTGSYAPSPSPPSPPSILEKIFKSYAPPIQEAFLNIYIALGAFLVPFLCTSGMAQATPKEATGVGVIFAGIFGVVAVGVSIHKGYAEPGMPRFLWFMLYFLTLGIIVLIALFLISLF